MTRTQGPRVILGPADIAGWHLGLYHGLKELGVDAVYAGGWSPHAGLPEADTSNFWVRLSHWASKRHLTTPVKQRTLRLCWAAINRISKIPLFLWALFRFDVFVYCFAKPYLFRGEILLLKGLGKKVIALFHGSDSRPPFIDETTFNPARLLTPKWCLWWTTKIKRSARSIEQSALCVCSPTSGQFFTKPFINWQLALGMPFRIPPGISNDIPNDIPGEDNRVRILHCPSHLLGKGTPTVREVIQRLKTKGHKIDYVELHGRSHGEVLQELNRCAFAIDQLHSDLGFSGFGTEAAHFGRIAITCGYAMKQTQEVATNTGMPMGHFCYPEEFETLVERMIVDREYREYCGRKAKEFVTTRWHVTSIAERFMTLITGDIPDNWWVLPNDIRYLHGFGLSEARAKQRIAWFIALEGPSAMQIDDKPELRQAFIDFANFSVSPEVPTVK